MIVQYASDLHLEFPQNKEFLRLSPIEPKGELLLLAGDIVPFAVLDKHNDFFDYISDHFHTTYWIPGNHEYYYYDITKKKGAFSEKIRNNIWLLNNTVMNCNNTSIICSTLWSKINPPYQWQIENRISDFQLIQEGDHKFSTASFNLFHQESLSFIKEEVQKNSHAIVMTHHVPTFMNYPDQYKTSLLSDAFAIELSDWIESTNIAYWLYGHHHQNVADFKIGDTTMITNQLGYVNRNEHTKYNSEKYIII